MADYEDYVAKGQGMRDQVSNWASRLKNFAGEAGKYGKGVIEGMMNPDPNAAFKGQGLDPEINAVGKEPSPALRAQQPVTQGRFQAPAQTFNPIPEAGGAGGKPPAPPAVTAAPAAGAPKGPIPGALPPEQAALARQPTYVNTGDINVKTPPGYTEVNPAAEAEGTLAKGAKGLRNLSSGRLPGVLAVAGEALDPNVRKAVDPTSDMSTIDRIKQGGRSALRVGGGILGGVAGSAVLPVAGTVAGGYAGYKAGDYVADKLFGEQQAPAAPAAGNTAAPAAPAPVAPNQTPMATSQGPQTPAQLMDGTAVPAPGNGAFQRTGGQAQGLRATTFDGLGPMPADATPEQAAEWLKKTNVINQGRAAEGMRMQAQPGGGGDELAPLRRLAALDAGAKPGHAGVGSMAALGAYGALDRMKSNAANLNLRQQQIQATSDLAASTRAQTQANTDREFANKVGEQNAKTRATEHMERATRDVSKNAPQQLTEGNDAYQNRIKAAAAEDSQVFERSAQAAGQDPNTISSAQRKKFHTLMDVRKQVLTARDDGLADYFRNSRVDSDVAQAFEPKSVELATRPFEHYIVTTQNGNRIPLKSLEGGGFQWTGSNKPINAEFAAMVQPLINAHNKQQSKGK